MESSQATADSYSGFSPLMSSILELTREIENLDDEPLVREPRKVLWAKKRFPRQGIRCRANGCKRRKYIRATARDFPAPLLGKPDLAISIPAANPVERPPEVGEIFRREGSAETREETESSASDPDPAAKSLSRDAQTPIAGREDVENLSSNNNDGDYNIYYADGFVIGNKMQAKIHGAMDSNGALLDSDAWCTEESLRADDDSSHRAVNVSADEEDAYSTYSSYSTRNDEISVDCLGHSTHHEGVKYIVSKVYYQVNAPIECHEDLSSVMTDGVESSVSTTKPCNSNSGERDTGKRREPGTRNKQRKTEGFADAGPSSQHSGASTRRGSDKASAKRRKATETEAPETCFAGKGCFASRDPSPVGASTAAVARQNSPEAPQSCIATRKAENWSKKEWDNFFCLFSAVAAEAHTLQSLGSNNMAANKRWLQCMRTILQKPPV